MQLGQVLQAFFATEIALLAGCHDARQHFCVTMTHYDRCVLHGGDCTSVFEVLCLLRTACELPAGTGTAVLKPC